MTDEQFKTLIVTIENVDAALFNLAVWIGFLLVIGFLWIIGLVISK